MRHDILFFVIAIGDSSNPMSSLFLLLGLEVFILLGRIFETMRVNEVQIVSGSQRQRPYIRRVPDTAKDPTPLQAAQRLRLSLASHETYGMKGIVERQDGTRIPVNAAVVAAALQGSPSPENYPVALEQGKAEVETAVPSQGAELTVPVLRFTSDTACLSLIGKRYKGEKKAIGGQEGNTNAKNEVVNFTTSIPESKNVESYLMGKRYSDEKKTAEKIAEQNKISEKTVRNAEIFSESLDKIAGGDKATSKNSSALPGTLLMICADLFDAYVDQRLIPMIMAPPAAPKTFFPSKHNSHIMENSNSQNSLQEHAGFMMSEISRLSTKLQALRAENTQIKQRIAGQVASQAQPAPLTERRTTMPKNLKNKYGFMG